MHRLSLALLGAKDAPGVTQALHFHLREDFSVPHVALKLWAGEDVPAELRDKAESMGRSAMRRAAGSPFLGWFGEAADHVRSIALIPLGQTRTLGLLALGSEDPQRFFAEMGTLYLRRIGELTAGALARAHLISRLNDPDLGKAWLETLEHQRRPFPAHAGELLARARPAVQVEGNGGAGGCRSGANPQVRRGACTPRACPGARLR